MGNTGLTLSELIEATGVTEKRLRYLLRKENKGIPEEMILQRTGTGRKILFAPEVVAFLKATEKVKAKEVLQEKTKEVLPEKTKETRPRKTKDDLPGAAEIMQKLEQIESKQDEFMRQLVYTQKLILMARAAAGDAEIMIKLIELLPEDALRDLFNGGETN